VFQVAADGFGERVRRWTFAEVRVPEDAAFDEGGFFSGEPLVVSASALANASPDLSARRPDGADDPECACVFPAFDPERHMASSSWITAAPVRRYT
jgi:hypothetical protein